MELKSKNTKLLTIIGLTAVISIIHYGTAGEQMGLHILHREFYFIPIILAGFWFGLRIGLATSIIISLIYAPHVFIYDDAHSNAVTVFSQILIFNLVAVVLGWLVDRQRQHQEKMIGSEKLAVLGRAATAVGNEMRDILGALKGLCREKEALQCTELDLDFNQEMNRLERLVETLSMFVPREEIQTISKDLNAIIQDRVGHHQEAARAAGIHLTADPDEKGCPSQVNVAKIGWILDKLITNALEVSSPGQTVRVRSRRHGSHCSVEVEDEGQGIKPEHLPKMFVPFFTTRESGTGLSLASARKALREMGGDIQVASTWGKGTTFTILAPRENVSHPMEETILKETEEKASPSP